MNHKHQIGLMENGTAEPTDEDERTLQDGLCSLLINNQRNRTTNTIK